MTDEPALSRAELERMAELFAVLSDPTRLQILQLLKRDERTVGDLVDQLPVKQAAVSKQLAHLFEASIVDRRRDGQRIWYRIRDPMVLQLCAVVCSPRAENAAEIAVAPADGSRPLG